MGDVSDGIEGRSEVSDGEKVSREWRRRVTCGMDGRCEDVWVEAEV